MIKLFACSILTASNNKMSNQAKVLCHAQLDKSHCNMALVPQVYHKMKSFAIKLALHQRKNPCLKFHQGIPYNVLALLTYVSDCISFSVLCSGLVRYHRYPGRIYSLGEGRKYSIGTLTKLLREANSQLLNRD